MCNESKLGEGLGATEFTHWFPVTALRNLDTQNPPRARLNQQREEGGGGRCSYPGVLVHTDVDLLLRGRLNEHLVPLASRVAAKHSLIDIDLRLFNTQDQTVSVFVHFIPSTERKTSEEARLKISLPLQVNSKPPPIPSLLTVQS